uniref:Uncharacterized protein n=1 Tax=Trichinella nativa TaxID=6335 RepID=A0A0V1KHI1_9BILA
MALVLKCHSTAKPAMNQKVPYFHKEWNPMSEID